MIYDVIDTIVSFDKKAVRWAKKHILGKEEDPKDLSSKEKAVEALKKYLPEDEAYAVLKGAEQLPGMTKGALSSLKKVKKVIWD